MIFLIYYENMWNNLDKNSNEYIVFMKSMHKTLYIMFSLFFHLKKELKCFQNDIFIYNNYANIFIIICYVLTPKEYF
jgi:hypothetical protein